jgi:hypothetical protein
MAAVFSNMNLVDGQIIGLPFEVTGTVAASGGAQNIVSVARQVDDQSLVDISGQCNPELISAPAPSVDFAFALTDADCATPGFYILTVMAWDDDPNAVGAATATVTFQIAPSNVNATKGN